MLTDQTAIDVQTTEQPTKGKRKGKGKPTSPPATEGKKGKRKLSIRQRAALASAGVATGLMALSVSHLTEAISALTGSHWALSGLLAVGIDAGMLCAETALLLSGRDREAKGWAVAYVWTAALASALLNAFAFSMHSPEGMAWTALPLGFLVPLFVLALGKIGGRLWLGDAKEAKKA